MVRAVRGRRERSQLARIVDALGGEATIAERAVVWAQLPKLKRRKTARIEGAFGASGAVQSGFAVDRVAAVSSPIAIVDRQRGLDAFQRF